MRHARLNSLFAVFLCAATFAPMARAQLISTVAGNGGAGFTGDGVSATSAELNNPFGVALDKNNNIYIADTGNNRVRVVNTGTSPITIANVTIQPGMIGTVAGSGGSGFSGDGGAATSATLTPYNVAVDTNGVIYIADTANYRIRAVNPSNTPIKVGSITIPAAGIETVAGSGSNTFGGDGGPATGAGVYPWSLAVHNGNIYVADTANNRIRVVNQGSSALTVGNVTIQPGDINTVAGSGNYGIGGDGGSALNVSFEYPYGVAVDGNGNIYICDTYNRFIHAVNGGTSAVTIAGVTIQPGNIAVVAGIGSYGFRGDGLPSITAEFADPDAVQVDSAGNFYVSDTENERIRMVSHITGLTSTIAGTAAYGYNGDGIAATSAWITYPRAIATDSAGNVYFADEPNERIRKINENPGSPAITSRSSTAFMVGVPGSFTVTTADLPTPTLSATGLPSWLTFVDNGNGTGTLSGMPTSTTGSPYTFSFTASNGVPPNAVQNFTLTVYPPGGAPAANLVTEDTTTQGSWQGAYGADGYDLANANADVPSYATFSVSNQVNYTWTNLTTDPRALQIPGSSTRFAAAWYSNSTMVLDVNITDGNTHQFALYAVDWDSQGRSETIQIVDANSGNVLDTETLTNFVSGVYLVWNVSGHVQVNVLPNNQANGVISGVFFGGAGALPNPILAVTKTHAGTFTQGQNDTYTVTVSNLPHAAATSGQVTVQEIPPSGLTLVSMAGTGWSCGGDYCSRSDTISGGTSYQPITVTVTVAANATTPQVNQVTVTGGGSQSASATDSTTIVAPGGSAVVNSPAEDTQTQGAWQGIYGSDGYSIEAVSTQVIPAYATFAVQNGQAWTWASNPNDPRALQIPGGGSIAATWYNQTSFYFDVNVGGSAHPFAIYAMDWDGQGRAETIQILDANTGAVLYNQQITNFVNGVYLSWSITGHVHVTVTTNAGPNCVVSGVFFGGGPNPEAITATGGTPQSATVGSTFAAQLQATVLSSGNPVNGASVTFTAPASGASGTFTNGSTSITLPTNSSGVASAAFTANGTAGGPYSVTATAAGASGTATYSLTNNAAPVEIITATAGTPQSATVGNAFATQLQATVLLGGNAVNGASVTFTAPSSGASGTFSNGSATISVPTNSSGIASASFTANSTAGGPYSVTASVSGASTNATFSLTNNAAPVETISATAGASQSSVIGAPFTTQLQATVMLGATPVSGANVVFTAPSSGASGTFSNGTNTITLPTNSSGIASASFSANSTVGGPYLVTAATSGVTGAANFSLTNTQPGGTCATPPCATFIAFDSVTQGNWQTMYGPDGYYMANSASQTPSYASFSVASQLNYTWDSSPNSDPRALQVPAGGRIAAAWYSSASFTFNINITDGNTHPVAFYAVDWDNHGRAETFEVIDPNTNNILDIRSVSNFESGIWLVWNVTGHVLITVTNTTYPNGVVSGVFFGRSGSVNVNINPPVTNIGPNGTQQFSATVIGSTNQAVTWAISPSVGTISQTGLYTAPATASGTQTVGITATSAVTGSTIGTAIVNLTSGAIANFITYDTTTQGAWQNIYGTTGYSLANVTNQLIPSFANFAVQNEASYTWAGSTSDSRALQVPGTSSGIAATWYSASGFNINVNFTDGNAHQFELYAVDWDNKGRAETIQVLDANTNAVLDTRNISNFGNGVYLIWNISGSVKINITLTAGANAVISGAFFN